ncbi:MAG: hypothetical protein SVU32_05835, partial [Candidatus Nanohaloarchaea archaeon]|nr:hypothetical protein [Candidatus Nanohaloarchaea archaeon]
MLGRRTLVGAGLLVLSGIVLWPLADAIIIGVVTAYGLRFLIERMEQFVDRRVAEVLVLSGFFVIVSGGLYLLVSNAGTVALELLKLSRSLSEGVKVVLEPYNLPYLSDFVLSGIKSMSTYVRAMIF